MRRRFLNNINKNISGGYYSEYFTIEALEDGLTVSLSQNECEYRIDNGSWNMLLADTNTASINKGQTLSFKGNLTPKSYNGIGTFTISKKCNLKGNIMSLLYEDDFKGQNDLTGKNYAFYNLFQFCESVINASDLILPARILSKNCYAAMFSHCIRLTTAPHLPATTLASDCYATMFQYCTSLVTAPELPATILTDLCYFHMFDCCEKLNYIKMLATDISAFECLTGWVYDVANSGTFVKHPDMTTLPSGEDGIPTGWTVTNLITFTIDGVEYQAEEGMTWYQWCNSKYNTDGYIACGEEGHIINIDETQYICNSNYYLILSDETIKLNYAYVLNEFEKNIITFTFNILSTRTEHQAEEGMTWEEWVNSEYNTCGVYIMSNGKINVPGNGFEYIYNSTTSEYDGVYKTDIIQNNHQYNGFGGSSGD